MDHFFQESAETLNCRSSLFSPVSPFLVSAGDKGSYTSEIRRFGLDLLWQKWDLNLVSPFYASDTCQCLLELCLDGDWPGRAGFKKEIKPILSVSRKKKQLFYLLIHTKNPHFSFTEKPKEVIFHSGRSCRMKREKRFFQGFFSEADAPCIPMTTEGW